MKTWRETIISIHADNARVFASVPPLCRHRSTSCPRRGLRLSLRLFSPSPPPFPILETPIPRFLILDRVEFVENYSLKMGGAILNFHPSIVPLKWTPLPSSSHPPKFQFQFLRLFQPATNQPSGIAAYIAFIDPCFTRSPYTFPRRTGAGIDPESWDSSNSRPAIAPPR